MKKTRVVIPAMALIAFSAAASITGTVAWFSANQTVNIKGMAVKTSVSNNLFIAGDTLDSTTKKGDSDFSNGPLTQEVKAYLEPVSTVNGTSFYYTVDAKADGNVKDPSNRSYVAYDASAAATDSSTYANKFSEDYGVAKTVVNAYVGGSEYAAKAYVDYVFQVRAQNATTSTTKLSVSKLDLIYGGAADASKAYRVAFFVEDISSANPAGGVGTLNMIYSESGAANFTTGQAVTSTTALGAVTYNTADTYLDSSIAASATKQYKIVARLWLEGEDTTCSSSTYAALTSEWKLNIELKLDSSASPVSNIKKYTSFTASNSKLYFCDGTNAYAENTDPRKVGEPGEVVNNARVDGLADAEALQAELNTGFGKTLTYPAAA